MKKCDIIIPIYNAYDCLAPCIDSVINNTDFSDGSKLFLINDASPDERVLPLLKSYEKKYSFIELIENEKNKGFVNSVNEGMSISKNDVVLLNSDTEVTAHWLERMMEAAYKFKNVATVTPLSNNATLVSVPDQFHPNDLPEGMTAEEMGKVVYDCSYFDYPEIPSGHGFCLYIKREVLDKIGLFDAKAYGRGYGEENDFCYRALNYGYRHILCDCAYVYHKESKSFAEDKKELIKEGDVKLRKRYTKYVERLDRWCISAKMRYIGQNIANSLAERNKKNILFIIHDWKDIKANIGGTTLHAMDLIKHLRNEMNIHVLAPEGECYKLYSYFKKSETELVYPGVSEFHEINYYNNYYKEMIENIIDEFGISLVHIHHIKGHYFDLFDVLKEKNIYSIFTTHDFYSVCPTINLLYKNKKFCEKPTKKMCSECLYNRFQNNIDIDAWQKCFKEALSKVDLIISPSEATKLDMLRYYPDLKIKVIEHGVDIKKETSTLDIDSDYNIAFVGGIGPHKGIRVLDDLLGNRKLKNIKIHLFGIIGGDLSHKRRLINHGPYKRDDLARLLKENNIKLVCLLSIWPETYSYTLQESIASGIPVITFDFGATAERVNKYGLGWTVDHNNMKAVANTISDIFKDKEGYLEKIDNINKYKVKTTKKMASEYLKIYEPHLKDVDIDWSFMKARIRGNRIYDMSYTGAYDWLFKTLAWRIVTKVKVPRFIKKMLKRGSE